MSDLKVKFTRAEKIAGGFMATVLFGIAVTLCVVVYKQGWFASHVKYTVSFERAQGVFPGTKVEMTDLKIGHVESVEIQNDGQIIATISVLKKIQERIKEDSLIRVVRPFIIGDKALDLIVGTSSAKSLAPGGQIRSELSFDILESLDGRALAPYMKTFSEVAVSLKSLAEAFIDPKRTESLVKMFDRMAPLLDNLNNASLQFSSMSQQMTHNKNLQMAVENLAQTTLEMNKILKSSPDMAKNISEIVRTTSTVMQTLNQLMPAIQSMAPEMPKATHRAVEALNEV
ncbi:MAG: MlaD family protein [Oligoflexia bacterium]|nr:MlaD family protein [Oligoflexia bacterium]